MVDAYVDSLLSSILSIARVIVPSTVRLAVSLFLLLFVPIPLQNISVLLYCDDTTTVRFLLLIFPPKLISPCKLNKTFILNI